MFHRHSRGVIVALFFSFLLALSGWSQVTTNLPPLSGSIGVWGDLDNDGLVDVLLAGTVQGVTNIPDGRFTRIYHNAGAGIFSDNGATLPQLDNAAAAWGDCDNDGDLDLLISGLADGTNGPVSVTEIYRNDGSNHFISLNAGLEPLGQGSVAWVDFDNDGWQDVFVCGLQAATTNWVSRLYRNNGNGTFTLAITNLPTPQNARGYWADCNSDGYADLLLAGSDAAYLFKNNGAGGLTNANLSLPSTHRIISPWGDLDGDGDLDFMTSSGTLPSIISPLDYHPSFSRNDGNGAFSSAFDSSLDMWLFSASWGDIDNSGRACAVVAGWVPLVPGGGVWGSATKVYIYLGSSWQEVFTLGGWDNLPETWVDYDGDGALDIFTTGGGQTSFWKNTVALHRDFPQAPLTPTNAFTALDAVTLSWQTPAGTSATGRGLSYNVRVGHTPGSSDVVSPLADAATGRRLIQALGNAGAAHVFKLNNLPVGNYYWSVQSIGQSFTGSPFTTEGMFTVTSSPPVIVTQPTNLTVLSDSNAVFAVVVIGTKPLLYQWRKDGLPLNDNGTFSGSTSLTLTISNAQPNLAGAYDLVITNLYGSVTSAVVALVVHGEPRILSQPVNQYPIPTRPAAFTVSAAGTAPLIYQWDFNGTPLSDSVHLTGTATPALSVQNVGPNDVGAYSVIISNAWGSITSAVVTLNLAAQRFVNLNNPSPVSPYTNWATAATVIQNAIDVSGPGDDIVVTNGIYATGGRAVYSNFVNRVAVDRPVTLRSLNGPAVTTIQGVSGPASSAIRCAYLTNGAVLSGFTITSGGTRNSGDFFREQSAAGVYCESVSAVVSNCIITGNAAQGYGAGVYSGTVNNCTLTGNSSRTAYGGGVAFSALTQCIVSGNSANGTSGSGGGGYSCSLTNCVITGNSSRSLGGGLRIGIAVGCLFAGNSSHYGGGGSSATLINCTIVNNSAVYDGTSGGFGGGVYGCAVQNSILVQNTSGWPGADANAGGSAITYSCTPTATGTGNISAAPAFVDYAGGNFRLASGSPGINAGTNDVVATASDLDGQSRVVDAAVDMGAYEYHHAPFLIVSPASQSVLLLSNVLFTVSAIGDPTLSYQWQKDGVNLTNDARIGGAFAASLSISNLVLQDAAGYRVVVSNATATVTSTVATLTLLGLPIISNQPISRSVPAGTNVSFSVTASGLAALSYQWRFNQSGIFAKTNNSLSLTNVQSANAGDFDVVITNNYGAITSSIATLTVVPSVPTITTQALSRVASVGQNVSFTVAAKGSEPMTCQWLFNGTKLPGANGFTLAFTNVNSSFSGTYRAAVSNAVGGTFSTNVTLVVSPVLIWGQTNSGQLLASAAIPASVTNVIAITAAGSTDVGLPCMALRADGSIAPWGYSSRDPAPPTNVADVVAISINSSGGSANNLALLADGTVVNWNSSATKPPVPSTITNQNIVAIAAGGLHQLALRDNGTVLAWGVNTSGQTNVPASATNVIAVAAGTSHSLALRADGTVVSWGLNTSGQVTALSNLVNVAAISAGGNQSLALLADGTVVGRIVTNNTPVGLLYGPPPANATNMIAIAAGLSHSLGLRADRTVTGWGQTNSGQLNPPAFATNVLAIAAGGGDSLALVRDPFAPPLPPRIGRPPLSRALKTGDNVVLNALAVGGLPLHFQWYRDGVPLAGKTNQWLGLTSAHPRDAGNYQLVAINDFGATTSAVASVTVSLPQPVLKSPARGTNGFSFTFDSISGVIYVSEFKNALVPGAWTELERRLGIGGIEVVTDTNPDGAARFYRVWAVYAPSPTLALQGSTGSSVNFNLNTVAGAVYVIQYKGQLSDPTWLELSRQTGTGAAIVVADPNPPGPSRFYRAKVE